MTATASATLSPTTTTLRRPRRAAPPPPQRVEIPLDVRLMNAVASAVFGIAGAALLAGGAMWLMRSPMFPIRGIELEGDLARNSVPTIRANAAPRLSGNFFSADLQAGRAAFEAVPWVRRAVVRRVWPDRLAVRLEEHHPVALWEGHAGTEAAERLVNAHGEVFEANVGDVEDEDLPRLAGPEGNAAAMLALLERIAPVLRTQDLHVERLRLTQRGSWRAELDSGAVIELGRGSADEVIARVDRFSRTLAQVTARWQQPLEYADLRHSDGYAIRLQGVGTTTTPPAPGKPAATAKKN